MNFAIINFNKYLIFFILVFSLVLNAQRRHSQNIPPVFIETHLFHSDSTYKCFVSYRIPFDNLLFVKEGGSFNSGVSVLFELKNSQKDIKRFLTSSFVSTKKYSETISDEVYLQGLFEFDIKKGHYKLFPTVTLKNAELDLHLHPIELRVDSFNVSFPIFLAPSATDDSDKFVLNNLQNSIPFVNSPLKMLIPIYNDFDSISVTIEQEDERIFSKTIFKKINLSNRLIKYNDRIIIPKGNELKYFVVDNYNQRLVEGRMKIKINADEKYEFASKVIWVDKPESLMNIEEAIAALKLIGFDSIADSLDDLPDSLMYKGLFGFWKRFDDDKNIKFNKVFEEFYSRIDYIKEHFNSLGKHDALQTDRGEIYLVYGRPSKIERKYSDVYNIIEVWTYDSINEKIYFSDKSGTGKFTRIK